MLHVLKNVSETPPLKTLSRHTRLQIPNFDTMTIGVFSCAYLSILCITHLITFPGGLLAGPAIDPIRLHGPSVRGAGPHAAGDPGHQDAGHPGRGGGARAAAISARC